MPHILIHFRILVHWNWANMVDISGTWNQYLHLLSMEITVSFLIGHKHLVNFWNQCVSRTLNVTGNHIMYNCSASFFRPADNHAKLFPISEKAKTCIPLFFIQLSIIKQLLLDLVFTDIQSNQWGLSAFSFSWYPQPQPWMLKIFWIPKISSNYWLVSKIRTITNSLVAASCMFSWQFSWSIFLSL